jgi:hypothetical protein
MLYQFRVHADALKGEGTILVHQDTTWHNLGYADLLMIQESYASWLASLPGTLGQQKLAEKQSA